MLALVASYQRMVLLQSILLLRSEVLWRCARSMLGGAYDLRRCGERNYASWGWNRVAIELRHKDLNPIIVNNDNNFNRFAAS